MVIDNNMNTIHAYHTSHNVNISASPNVSQYFLSFQEPVEDDDDEEKSLTLQ